MEIQSTNLARITTPAKLDVQQKFLLTAASSIRPLTDIPHLAPASQPHHPKYDFIKSKGSANDAKRRDKRRLDVFDNFLKLKKTLLRKRPYRPRPLSTPYLPRPLSTPYLPFLWKHQGSISSTIWCKVQMCW